ncbi:unnamed protein product [Ectocarpus fasciculatus]
MSDLEDTFLEDLDDLGDDSDEESEQDYDDEERHAADQQDSTAPESASAGGNKEVNLVKKLAAVRGIENIAVLRRSGKFQQHMEDIALSSRLPETAIVGTLESDKDYKLVIACNALVQSVDEEMASIHRYVAEMYSTKFKELESLVQNKVDYIKTVQRIGNGTDMTLVDLSDILPASSVMVVSVTGSTGNNTRLSEHDLGECLKGCEEMLLLEEAKATMLRFVESRMGRIAPNTCNLVGARVAAQLIGLAGGLEALSRIPSCNIQVMGQEKRHLSGFSNAAAMPHTGVLHFAEPVQRCPPDFRRKVLKMLAGKVALAARVDSYKNHADGHDGERMRREFDESVDKLLEPHKARTKKALPIPEEKKRNKRGGKRVRRWKERFELTEVRKQQNRIVVTTTEGEYGDSAMGVTQGSIGAHAGTGKIRAPQKKEQPALKKPKLSNSMSSGQTNGLSSSLVFTPVQGIELNNPHAAAERVKEANKKWFNPNSGFVSAVPK